MNISRKDFEKHIRRAFIAGVMKTGEGANGECVVSAKNYEPTREDVAEIWKRDINEYLENLI